MRMSYEIAVAVVVLLVFIWCYTRAEGMARINRHNASWHKFGYEYPPEAVRFRSNDAMYKKWEAYWQRVDVGQAEATRDPMIYYSNTY